MKTSSGSYDDVSVVRCEGGLTEIVLKDQLDVWRAQRLEQQQRRFMFKTRTTTNATTQGVPPITDEFLEERLRIVALDISQSLKEIHNGSSSVLDQRVVGNLSPSTIVLDSNGRAKLRDAPQEKHIDFRYRAPEAMAAVTEHLDSRSDVYAFAMVLWEVATLGLPYDSILGKVSGSSQILDNFQLCHNQILQRKLLSEQVGKKKVRPSLDAIKSRDLRKLLENCWDPNPDARPPMTRVWYILHHTIFPPVVTTTSSSQDRHGPPAVGPLAISRVVPHLRTTNERLLTKNHHNSSSSFSSSSTSIGNIISKNNQGTVSTRSCGGTVSSRPGSTEYPSMGHDDDDDSVYSDELEEDHEDDYTQGVILHYASRVRRPQRL